MGNTSSSGRGHQEETVDFGYLTPQGIYTGPRDWNQAIVTQLIVDRKLAPFYRPLEDYNESWDDDQITAAMKEPQQPENAEADSAITRAEGSSIHSISSRTHHKRPSTASKEIPRNPEAAVYRGAAECPICFLYYPNNINHSRCCDQAICTECFVQIKRADPTTTHLVSEPASCPYCVQENFGVVYTPPSWRAGIGSEGWTPPVWTDNMKAGPDPTAAMKRRRRSFGADSPEVVTIDQIRPDWEAKLAAVRATVARRANRRIIMRQVGDRLIPIGISSGRVHALPTDEAQGEGGEGNNANDRGSRRSRRRQQNQELNQYLGQMGLAGQDLEELMIMEAMRLSLIDHEDQQRKQHEEEEKKKREGGGSQPAAGEGSAAVAPSVAATNSSDPPTLPPLVFTESSDSTPTPSRVVHRSSSSLSRLSARLTPERSSTDRRSPSPIGALGAALRSATSTAAAVASPPPVERAESSPPLVESPTSIPQVASPISPPPSGSSTAEFTTMATPVNSAVPHVSVTEPAPAGKAASADLTPDEDTLMTPVQANSSIGIGSAPYVPPLAQRSTSFASSIASDSTQNHETYDTLPSSPASSSSSLAHKPLLDASVSEATQTPIVGGTSRSVHP